MTINRNDPCPCGSGKKYKHCCIGKFKYENASNQNISGLPDQIAKLYNIGSVRMQYLIDTSKNDPYALKDNNYWYELGVELGHNNFHEQALICFKKALKLNSKDYESLSNLAVTQNILGDHIEALLNISKVPDGKARKEIIKANILQDLQRHEEAISYYEKGIDIEPDFYLPYARLLNSLLREGRPSYEHWLYKTIRRFKDSPEIALHYTNHLLAENKYQELAEANWVLNITQVEDENIVGKTIGDKAILFSLRHSQEIVKSLNTNDKDQITNLVNEYIENKGLLISGRSDYCKLAKLLTIKSASLGLGQSVKSIYIHICDGCKADKNAFPYSYDELQIMIKNGEKEYGQSIEICEKILESDPQNEFVLNSLWWALDEIGQTDKAISFAESLFKLNPLFENLAYNIGYICGKKGDHGKSKFYYQTQIENNRSHLYAYENLAFVHIVEKEYEKSRQTWDMCKGIIQNQEIPSSLESLDDQKNNIIDYIRAFNIKSEYFDKLYDYAIDIQNSTSYALDIINYNNNADCVIGSQTAIKPNYDFSEILNLILSDSEAEKAEGVFLKKMQERKDYSIIQKSLTDKIALFNNLPLKAKTSLIEAERRIIDKLSPDFAPCILGYAKAVEISVRELVFEEFKKYSENKIFDIEYYVQITLNNNLNQAKNFVFYIAKGKHLELGSMAFALKISKGKTAEKIELLKMFYHFILDQLKKPDIIDNENIATMEKLASIYRNPAVHSEINTQEEAFEARELSLNLLNLIS